MKRRTVLAAIFLIAACASPKTMPESTVKLSPGYGVEGTRPVGVIPDTSLHDARRNKDLPISVNYPIYGGPYPVIMPLASYWTTFGYVVIRPSHADAGKLRELFDSVRFEATAPSQGGLGGQRDRGGRRGGERPAGEPPSVAAAAARSIEDIWDKEREPQWRDRAADISLVIDSLGDLETRFPELRGKIDHTKIGVAGHSYGAFTTMLVSGSKTFSTPPLSPGDPRVTAAIAMSPQGVSSTRGLTAESWHDVKVPMLYMTGSRDMGVGKEEDPAWRKTAFTDSPPGNKYFVEIEGANHLSFTGRLGTFERSSTPLTEPRDTMGTGRSNLADTSAARRPEVGFGAGRNTFRIIRDVSTSFWDAYLKGDNKGKEFLQTKVASDVVKVERK